MSRQVGFGQGLNLAGVETVLDMERLHTEIVPYGAYEPELPRQIPVTRPSEGEPGAS